MSDKIPVPPSVRQYFQDVAKKRGKDGKARGGFNSPEVQAKALKTRLENNAKKKKESSQA